MSVQAESGVGTQEKPRVRSGVGQPCFQKGCHLREGAIEPGRPVKCCPSRAQTKLAVAQRGSAGYNGSEINRRMQILPPKVHRRIANSAAGYTACRRTRCVHKKKWHTQVHAEMLGKRVTHAGVECVHLS